MMVRQDEAAAGMTVREVGDGGYQVVGPRGVIAGPFATHAQAWRWIDRNTPARSYGRR
jgi:hypothetical protein